MPAPMTNASGITSWGSSLFTRLVSLTMPHAAVAQCAVEFQISKFKCQINDKWLNAKNFFEHLDFELPLNFEI
jgi:hypothetical protein